MKTSRLVTLVWLLVHCSSIELKAFTVRVHADITKESLSGFDVEIAGKKEKFVPAAINAVQVANAAVDKTRPALLFPDRHFIDERFKDGSQLLIDLKAEIISAVRSDPPDGDQARQNLGRALHAVQDYYSHTTWIEMGRAGIDDRLGKQTIPDPSPAVRPCAGAMIVTSPSAGLSSGYYNKLTGCGSTFYRDASSTNRPDFLANLSDIVTGKCYHGNYTMACVGMNKDADQPTLPPGYTDQDPEIIRAGGVAPVNPLHSQARSAALQATTAYVQQILDELSGNDRALSALLGLRGDIGFVIDDTGSMGEEIAGVKSQITRLVNAIRADPKKKPDAWIFNRFGDPDVGVPLVTDSADQLLAAISRLTASGGGDCPELSQEGLRRTINKAAPNSRLYLYTDASAKDAGLANSVISAAQKGSIRLNYALTGSCSPIDQAYIRGADETGGQLFFINQFEIPLLYDLLQPQLAGDLVTILANRGMLTSPASFTVPVDSTLTTLVVSVSLDTQTLVQLRRPSGTLVDASNADVSIARLSSATIYTIQRPASGNWSLTIAGSGNYSVVAEGNSPLTFHSFNFVKLSEDIHGGFFPIEGQPTVGSNPIAAATLLGPFRDATFAFVTPAGTPLRELALTREYPSAVRDDFVGSVALPSVPFRVIATGTDASGVAFRRQFPVVYRAQPVQVEVEGVGSTEVVAGATTTLRFRVTNLGGPQTFTVASVSSLGAVTRIQPSAVALPAGGSAVIEVDISVPAGTAENTPLTLTTTATKSTDPTVFNSAILDLIVTANRPPDCSRIRDAKIVLWPANHKFVHVDVNAGGRVIDPDADPLTFVVNSITQDEPVDDQGDGHTTPDAINLGNGAISLRAERSGQGDGRVYRIDFTARDAHGAQCQSVLRVSVPKNQAGVAIEGARSYDSTQR